ncbi:hypothetical protein B0T10DRAFT_501944 [Thelonectria olida]|uniref:Uncharacterized protein n=1 Tax=Thelonectria olida TaxID=1576542 RepID=A0A9P9AHZ6_9HYPO|nr:hypothetical protein B0T10DRAFT_501944 [Thelonectria olida]
MAGGTWMEAYTNIANALLVTTTFAGAITFAIVLAPYGGDSASKQRPSYPVELLAYAGALFLGGAIGCIPIFVVCRAGDIDERRVDKWRCIAQLMFVTIGCIIIAAFGIFIGSLHYFGYHGPFILGVVLFVPFTIIPVLLGIFLRRNISTVGAR